MSQDTPHDAATRPSTLPAMASSRLSVRSCRTTRHGLAPNASRTATSCCRPDARASVELATFAHAINSTQVTIAIKASSVPRTPATTLSSSGRIVIAMPVLVDGCSRSSRDAMAVISCCACASETPGRSRPNTRSERPSRSSRRAVSASGAQSSARVCQNGAKRNDGGITPTTV